MTSNVTFTDQPVHVDTGFSYANFGKQIVRERFGFSVQCSVQRY